jgi:hypothetical protein
MPGLREDSVLYISFDVKFGYALPSFPLEFTTYGVFVKTACRTDPHVEPGHVIVGADAAALVCTRYESDAP